MTHYRFDNQEKKKNISRTKIAGIILGIAVLTLVIVFVIAPVMRSIARGPQWLRGAANQAAGSAISRLTPKGFIIKENTKLKSDIATYQAQLLELQMLRDENESLRKELSYLPHPTQTITAGVLAKPSESLYNSLIIDRGSRDGVSDGQLVTTQGMIGLGRIVSVTQTTATVQLFSGPQFNGNLLMKNHNITVPAIGKGGGNFEIHIPREIEVIDGDILAFPESPDLAVGVVKSVIFDARDPFQTVLARTPVNVQELRFVQVVK